MEREPGTLPTQVKPPRQPRRRPAAPKGSDEDDEFKPTASDEEAADAEDQDAELDLEQDLQLHGYGAEHEEPSPVILSDQAVERLAYARRRTDLRSIFDSPFDGTVYENLKRAPTLSLEQARLVVNGVAVPVGAKQHLLYRTVKRADLYTNRSAPTKNVQMMYRFAMFGAKQPLEKLEAKSGDDVMCVDELVALALLRWIPFNEFVQDPVEWRSLPIDRTSENGEAFLQAWRNSVAFEILRRILEPERFDFLIERWAAAYYYIYYLDSGDASARPEADYYGAPFSLVCNSWFEQLMVYYAQQHTRIGIQLYPQGRQPLWLYPNGEIPFEKVGERAPRDMNQAELDLYRTLTAHREAMFYEHWPDVVKKVTVAAGQPTEFEVGSFALDTIPFQISYIDPPLSELDQNLVMRLDLRGVSPAYERVSAQEEWVNQRPGTAQTGIVDLNVLNRHSCMLPGAISEPANALRYVDVHLSVEFTLQENIVQAHLYRALFSYEQSAANNNALLWHRIAAFDPTKDAAANQQTDRLVGERRRQTCAMIIHIVATTKPVVAGVHNYVYGIKRATVTVPADYDPETQPFRASVQAADRHDYKLSFLNRNAVVFYVVASDPAVASLRALATLPLRANIAGAGGVTDEEAEHKRIRKQVAELILQSQRLENARLSRAHLLGNTPQLAVPPQLERRLHLRYLKHDAIRHIERVAGAKAIELKARRGARKLEPAPSLVAGEPEAAAPKEQKQKLELQAGDWEVFIDLPDPQRTDSEYDLYQAEQKEGARHEDYDDDEDVAEAAESPTDQDVVSWQQLLNGAVITAVQRCAFLCDFRPEQQVLRTLIKDEAGTNPRVAYEVGPERVPDPTQLDSAELGYFGPNLSDGTEVLTVDLLLRREPRSSHSPIEPYDFAKDLILPEQFEATVPGEPRGAAKTKLRETSESSRQFFYNAVRQTGAALRLRSMLTEEISRGNIQGKKRMRDYYRRALVHVQVERTRGKQELHLAIDGSGGVPEARTSDMTDAEFLRQLDDDREREAEYTQLKHEAGMHESPEELAARQRFEAAEAEHARQAQPDTQKMMEAAQRFLGKNERQKKFDKLPINVPTRTSASLAWLGFIYAFEEVAAEEAEVASEARLTTALPDLYPGGTPGALQWAASVRRYFHRPPLDNIAPMNMCERAVVLQIENPELAMPYPNTDPRTLLDRNETLKYADQRLNVATPEATMAEGVPTFEEEEAAPVPAASRVTTYLTNEWVRLSRLVEHFKFLGITPPTPASLDTLFGSAARLLRPLLRNSWETEDPSKPDAKQVIIFKGTPLRQFGLNPDTTEDFDMQYLRLKTVQWIENEENAAFLRRLEHEYDLIPAVLPRLANIARTSSKQYSELQPLGGLSVLRAISQMFLLRFVVLFSPESVEQIPLERRTEVRTLLQREYFDGNSADELQQLLLADHVQFAVIEPLDMTPAGRLQPIGFFRTLYVGALVLPQPQQRAVMHAVFLEPIISYSDAQVRQKMAGEYRRMLSEMRAAEQQSALPTPDVLTRDPFAGEYLLESEHQLERSKLSTGDLTEIRVTLRNIEQLLSQDEVRYTHDEHRVNDAIRITVSDGARRLARSGVRFLRLRVRTLDVVNSPAAIVAYVRPGEQNAQLLGVRQQDSVTVTRTEQEVYWFAFTYSDQRAAGHNRVLEANFEEVYLVPLPAPPTMGKFAWPWLVEQIPPPPSPEYRSAAENVSLVILKEHKVYTRKQKELEQKQQEDQRTAREKKQLEAEKAARARKEVAISAIVAGARPATASKPKAIVQ